MASSRNVGRMLEFDLGMFFMRFQIILRILILLLIVLFVELFVESLKKRIFTAGFHLCPNKERRESIRVFPQS